MTPKLARRTSYPIIGRLVVLSREEAEEAWSAMTEAQQGDVLNGGWAKVEYGRYWGAQVVRLAEPPEEGEMLTDRMNTTFVLDRKPYIGRIIEFTQKTLAGTFTREYEIIACIPDTMVAVQFMCGFTRPCPWNSNHGFRRATDEEKALAQEWLAQKARELTA